MRIKERIQHIIKNSLEKMDISKQINDIEVKALNCEGEFINNEFSDECKYRCDIAISLAKDLHKKPEVIADMLSKNINDSLIESTEVVYPGIIILSLNKNTLLNGISDIISSNINYGKSNKGLSRKINVNYIYNDFSKNIKIKDLDGVIYFDNIARILKFTGYDVYKELYINNTCYDMDGQSDIIKDRYIDICNSNNNTEINKRNINDIRDTAYMIYSLYGNAKVNEDNSYFGKEDYKYSLELLKRKLDGYRVNFDNLEFEQSIDDCVDVILNNLNKSGNTYISDGSLWVKTNYNDYKKDILLTDKDGIYSDLLYKVSYYHNSLNSCDGVISVSYSVNGRFIKSILNIMHEDDINKLVLKDYPSSRHYLRDNNEIGNLDDIKDITINNIRYLLSSSESDDIDFDNSELSNIERVYVVINNLLKNYKKKITKVNEFSTISSDKSYNILNKLYEFEDIVYMVGFSLKPCYICDYLRDLSILFDEYYNEEEIITEDEIYTNERLNLLLAIKIVMNNAFNLIGIIPREEI